MKKEELEKMNVEDIRAIYAVDYPAWCKMVVEKFMKPNPKRIFDLQIHHLYKSEPAFIRLSTIFKFFDIPMKKRNWTNISRALRKSQLIEIMPKLKSDETEEDVLETLYLYNRFMK